MKENVKIDIHNLTKVFYKKQGSVTALDEISLSIQDGEFVCLIGPSGCGKTTLLRILAELETPSIGEFRFSQGKRNVRFSQWFSRKEESFPG